MTTKQHPHADHLAAIAQHLNNTAEANARNQQAGEPYTSKEGDYIVGTFYNDHGWEITFSYIITAYEHTADISVEVRRSGIGTRIIVPGNAPADVIAHTAISALRTTIDTITTAQQGAEA